MFRQAWSGRGTPISGKSKGGKCNQKTPLSAAPLLFYCQSCIAWNPQTFLHWTPKNPKKSFGRWSDSCSKTIEKLTGYDIFRIEIYSALGRTLHHKNFIWSFFFIYFPIRNNFYLLETCQLSYLVSKGQLNSKANFLALIWTQNGMKFFFDFCPSL